jgi:hypothetical protein
LWHQAYECLATLEGTSTLAQQALVGIQTLNRDELRNLSVYFDRVRLSMLHAPLYRRQAG